MNDVTLPSLEHQDVPMFLSTGDVGVIFRKDNLLNAVALPVKLGEYLSSGLFVLTTTGAREIANFVQYNLDIGYVLGNFPRYDFDEIRVAISLLKKAEF